MFCCFSKKGKNAFTIKLEKIKMHCFLTVRLLERKKYMYSNPTTELDFFLVTKTVFFIALFFFSP